ncbi:hypothetical protein BJX65DRAFT_269982 [Aspergillus insuetus]
MCISAVWSVLSFFCLTVTGSCACSRRCLVALTLRHGRVNSPRFCPVCLSLFR